MIYRWSWNPNPNRRQLPNSTGSLELIGKPLAEIEQWAVEQTLRLTGGNREETARILGIGARTLYRKIKEYGLQDK